MTLTLDPVPFTTINPPILSVPFLEPAECLRVYENIFALRKYWQMHGNGIFTLGAATYQDAKRFNKAIYGAKSRLFNPVLNANFAWLYARLQDTLSTTLGAPVQYVDHFALPGFHLFFEECWEVLQNCSRTWHTDEQFTLLDWPNEIDWEHIQTLSFTLPLTAPKGGAALNLWDIRTQDVMGLTLEESELLFKTKPPTYYAYTLGAIAMHSGLQFHSIAHPNPMESGYERVTLQGHGLNWDGTWHIYW